MTNEDETIVIGLLIALEEEYQTWRRVLGVSPIRSEGGYHFFEFPSQTSTDQIITVVVCVFGMGLTLAANATSSLLDKVKPKWLISIGLSGQLSNDCALGDVVVATNCDHAYSEARISTTRTNFAGKTCEVNALKAFINSIDASKFLQGQELTLPIQVKKKLEERKLWRSYPNLLAGVVCSTEFVVDSPKRKAELLTKNRRFLCTDMESAAMVITAQEKDFQGKIAIIRGVSDPADGTKKEIDELAGVGTIRKYAMHNATIVLLHSIISPLSQSPISTCAKRPIISNFIKRLNDVNMLLTTEKVSLNSIVAQLEGDVHIRTLDTDLAKFVYRIQIEKAWSDVPKPLKQEAAKEALQPAMNYFVALHVIRSLESDFENFPEILTVLTHVHSYKVNKYCKALLESAIRNSTIFRLIKRIKLAYDLSNQIELNLAAKSNLQAHLCYLLGRITGEQPAQQAKETLTCWREQLITTSFNNSGKKRSSSGKRQFGFPTAIIDRLSREQLLQFRTIQISLVQLGVSSESDNYIVLCIDNKKLDAQNRGFNLEYYGDISYDPEQLLSNEDKLDKCPKTLDTLGAKLINAFQNNELYALRDIELYTVISLLKCRLECGKLSPADRARGCEVLSNASWVSSNSLFARLRDRLILDMQDGSFQPNKIIFDIYGLKKLPRTGWTSRGRQVSKPESVASHTFGGLTLIELFLPETESPEGKALGAEYRKEVVHRLFLKHDWAEAFIGDLLPSQKTEESLAKEDAAFKMLDISFMYSPYVNRAIYEDWLEFEKGISINAKLARDIDQLDNLQQLMIERSTTDSVVPDEQQWINSIKERITTPLGLKLFSFIST